MSDARAVVTDARMGLVLELRTIPLFRDLGADELVPVAAIATHVSFDAGAVIFAQAGDGDRLFVISEGDVDIIRDDQRLATLGPGECFGEMALLDRTTRSATAKASTAVTVLTIARDDFNDLLVVYPAIARAIANVLAERLRNAFDRS